MTPLDLDIDIDETGPLTVFLDDLAANGLPVEMSRAFAGWLAKTIETLQDDRDKWKCDYQEFEDEHPDQGVTLPVASSFYHADKAGAEAVLNELLADPRVSTGGVQLQPYNGWMVVLVPALADISDLAGQAEIQDGKKRVGPMGKAGPAKPASPIDGPVKLVSPAGPAPTKGATAMVWVLADTAVAQGSWTRAAIISACVTAGINPATAATQFSKWKKERNL